MKTPYTALEITCLAITLAGLIMNLFDLSFAYMTSGVGVIAFGVVGLVNSFKNKYHIPSNGKILFTIISILLIAIGVSGIIGKTSYSTLLIVALLIYEMQLRKERTHELEKNGK